MEQSTQFATIQELDDEYDESMDELEIVTQKCVRVTNQVNEPNLQVYNQEEVAVVYEDCSYLEVQEQDMDLFYDALSTMESANNFRNTVDAVQLDQPGQRDIQAQGHSDALSPQYSIKVIPRVSAYYLNVKKKP